MIPTAAQVYAQARILLGDDEVAGGDLYTDAYLLPHLQQAVNTLFRALHHAESPLLERAAYCQLAAYSSYLSLGAIGASDLGEVISVRAKPVTAAAAISALTYNAGTLAWRATSVGHGRATGDLVYLHGVTAGPDEFINADWNISVISADVFDLLGSPSDTALTTPYVSGGSWIYSSSEDWDFPLTPLGGVQDIHDTRLSFRSAYDARRGALRIEPLETARLIELRYRMKPDNIVSTAPNLRVNGSLDALAALTAGLAALSKGADSSGQLWLARATGADSVAAIDEREPGGLLGELAQQHASLVRTPVQTQRFRPKRFRRW